MRRGEEIFADGAISVRFADADIACFERIGENEAIAVVVNRSDQTYEFISRGAVELLDGEKGTKLSILPMSAAAFKIKKDDGYTVAEEIPNPRDI
jgi:hypothetical protein